MRRFTRVAAALAAAAICIPAAAKEFRNSDVHPADYPTVMAVNYMSDIISKKTNGKHSIKTFHGGTLGSEKDTIEQTKLGGLDLVRINVAPMNNIVPETMVPTMPFLFRSKEHMRKVLDGPIGDEIDDGAVVAATESAASAAKKRKQSQSQSRSARHHAAGRSHQGDLSS